eukprot:gene6245-10253_t
MDYYKNLKNRFTGNNSLVDIMKGTKTTTKKPFYTTLDENSHNEFAKVNVQYTCSEDKLETFVDQLYKFITAKKLKTIKRRVTEEQLYFFKEYLSFLKQITKDNIVDDNKWRGSSKQQIVNYFLDFLIFIEKFDLLVKILKIEPSVTVRTFYISFPEKERQKMKDILAQQFGKSYLKSVSYDQIKDIAVSVLNNADLVINYDNKNDKPQNSSSTKNKNGKRKHLQDKIKDKSCLLHGPNARHSSKDCNGLKTFIEEQKSAKKKAIVLRTKKKEEKEEISQKRIFKSSGSDFNVEEEDVYGFNVEEIHAENDTISYIKEIKNIDHERNSNIQRFIYLTFGKSDHYTKCFMDDGAIILYIKEWLLINLIEGQDYIIFNYQTDLITYNGDSNKAYLIKMLIKTTQTWFWHHFWARIRIHLRKMLNIKKFILKTLFGFESSSKTNANKIQFMEDTKLEFNPVLTSLQNQLNKALNHNRKILKPTLQCSKLPFSKRIRKKRVKMKQYPIPHSYSKFLKENTLQKLEKVKYSTHPVWIVPKPGSQKLQHVDDIRVLNTYLPKISDLFTKLGSIKQRYITKIDLKDGFHNLLLHFKDCAMLGFIVDVV